MNFNFKPGDLVVYINSRTTCFYLGIFLYSKNNYVYILNFFPYLAYSPKDAIVKKTIASKLFLPASTEIVKFLSAEKNLKDAYEFIKKFNLCQR